MKQTGFIKGDNNEAKFASIERALQKMSRKTVKKVGVEVPPIPVSEYKDAPEEDGVLMRYMFPASGKVSQAVIWIEQFPEENKRIQLELHIETIEGNSVKNLEVTPKLNTMKVDMDVSPGSRFTLKLKDPDEGIRKVWLSFVYAIDLSPEHLQTLLIDKVDQIAEEYQDEGI